MFFDWLRRRRAPKPIPDDLWSRVLAQYPFLSARPTAEVARLRQLATAFLAQKEFHGAHDFVITDDVALAIAVQAVLPVLNLGLHWYDDFVGIVVHADQVVARRTVAGEDGVVHHYEEVIAGEAMDRGPIMLSWKDVEASAAHVESGFNVVVHEFIHKIDMRDGAADGCPPLPSKAARAEWMATMTREYQAFREKVIIAERFGGEAPWLDSYAVQGIDEFFAVACEAYFVNRARFEQEFSALMPLFDGFFGRLTPSPSRRPMLSDRDSP